MARYAILNTMAAELRAGLTDEQAAEYLRFALEAKLAGEGHGHRPVGEPEIEWTRIDARMATANLEMLRDAGFEDDELPPGYREGDWMVRVISETEPLPQPAG